MNFSTSLYLSFISSKIDKIRSNKITHSFLIIVGDHLHTNYKEMFTELNELLKSQEM